MRPGSWIFRLPEGSPVIGPQWKFPFKINDWPCSFPCMSLAESEISSLRMRSPHDANDHLGGNKDGSGKCPAFRQLLDRHR
jgi:hypothetical protein